MRPRLDLLAIVVVFWLLVGTMGHIYAAAPPPAQSTQLQSAQSVHPGAPTQGGALQQQASPPSLPPVPLGVENSAHFQAAKWFFEQRQAGLSGQAYGQALATAHAQAQALPQPRASAASLTGWTNGGPNPITNGQLAGGGAVTGHVTSIAVDPTNARRIFLSGDQGGIWRSLDGGSTWTSLTDYLVVGGGPVTFAIGGLAIDPSNPNIIYAGVGGGPYAFRSFAPGGFGLLKSVDGGTSWSLIASASAFANSYYLSFARTVVDPTGPSGCAGGLCRLYAATSQGLFRSTDGGANWARVAGGYNPADPGFPYNSSAFDVALDTTVTPAKVYAGIGDSGGTPRWEGVWSSTDGVQFTQFTLTNNGIPSRQDTGVWPGTISLAIDPRARNTVYAFMGHGSNDPASPGNNSFIGIYKTVDGSNWTLAANPAVNCQFGSVGGPCNDGNQWYNNVIAVDPTNSDVIVSATKIWRSADGGQSWTSVIDGTTGTGGTHVDQHAAVFAGGTLWVGNDGGIWNSADDGSSWVDDNRGGLTLTEFYPGASTVPSGQPLVLAGSQDNGTEYAAGNENGAPVAWREMFGGDGGSTAIDPVTQSYYVEAYPNYLYRIDSPMTTPAYVPIAAGLSVTGAMWPTWAFTLDPAHRNRLLLGAQSIYMNQNANSGSPVWTAISQPLFGTTGATTALAIATGDTSGNTIYAGTSLGTVFSTTSGPTLSTWTNVTNNLPAANRAVTSITTDGSASPTVYVTTSGFGSMHIARLAPSSTSWVDMSGDLPNAPTSKLLIAGNRLYAATDVGVLTSTNGGVNWSAVGSGMPFIQVSDLLFQQDSSGAGILTALTYGRGAWSITTAAPPPPPPPPAPPTGTCGIQPLQQTGAPISSVTYPAGWNLLAGPAGSVVSGNSGPLYTFPAGATNYQTAGTTLQAGVGYWAYFSSAQSMTLPSAGSGLSVSLPAGKWVMIGNPFQVALTVPSGDCLFTFSPTTNTYTQATTLPPGQGAWAFSSSGGSLALGTVPTVTAIDPSSGPAGGGTQVTVTGTNFSTNAGGTAVKFGNQVATAPGGGQLTCSATQCVVLSPAGSGTVDVTATVGGQTSATDSADLFTYSCNTPAQLTAPSPNATLPGSTVTFSWTTGCGASGYLLWIGSSSGSKDILDSGEVTGTQYTLTTMPTDGRTVYFQLWSLMSGGWQLGTNTTFTAAGQPQAALSSPTPGSTLTSAAVPFNWGSVAGADQYSLWAGKAVGTNEYYAAWLSTTSTTATNLPVDGGPVYVRLWTQFASGWVFTDYTFTAVTGAALASPTSSPLAGASVPFSWTSASGATQYALWVGKSAGTNEYYATWTTSMSTTTTNLPTDGSTVYVRLWTQWPSGWGFRDYSFTAPTQQKAVLSSPTPNSTLTSAAVPFSWGSVSGASQYSLWAGKSQGSNEYYAVWLSGISTTATNLPVDRSTVYVRLWTEFPSGWVFNDYSFTAVTGAALTSPASSPLAGASVPFQWNSASGASQYAIWVGKSVGTNEYYATWQTGTSTTATGLPTDGSKVYARLWTQWPSGWGFRDYAFTAATGPTQTAAQLGSPTPGSTLTSAAVPFSWNNASGAGQYALWAGIAVGTNDYYALWTSATNTTATDLPVDGSTVYVRLWTQFPSGWVYKDYTFTAVTGAALSSPAAGSTLSGARVGFSWSSIASAVQYALWAGKSAGTNEYYATWTSATSATATGLPTDGSKVYVRLWTQFPSGWGYRDYTFTAGRTLSQIQVVPAGQVPPNALGSPVTDRAYYVFRISGPAINGPIGGADGKGVTLQPAIAFNWGRTTDTNVIYVGPTPSAPAGTYTLQAPLPTGEVVSTTFTTASLATAAVQSLTVTGGAGTFTLTYGGQTTALIANPASAAAVAVALNALSSVTAAGGVTASGGPTGTGGTAVTITFGTTGPRSTLTGTGSGGATVMVTVVSPGT